MTLRHGSERASAALNEVRWFGEGKPLYTCSAVRTAHTDRWRENGEIEKEKWINFGGNFRAGLYISLKIGIFVKCN